jgi:Ca2+-binding EF-hand superfamily protein
LGEGLDEAASQQPLIEPAEANDEVQDEGEFCESDVWQSAWFQGLSGFVKGKLFESLAGSLVILSILWLTFGTDYKARMWLSEDPDQFKIVETFFLVGFSIEICLRIAVFGIKNFFCGPERYNCWLDLFLVMIQLIDVVQQMTDLGNGKTHWAPMLRVLRMIRILRLVRVFRFFPDLRMLIVSIIQSFQPLVWVFALVSTLTAVFAILITVVVTEYKTQYVSHDIWNEQAADDEQNLQFYFGSVSRSILSLYGTIAGGRDFHESAEPLEAFISPYMVYVFVAYTFFVIFAMMNVITSQFVDQTLEASAKDRRESMVSNLMDAFSKNTAGSKDLVSEEDFMQNLRHPSMRSFLKDLYKREDVSPEEIEKSRLFEMLDDDGSGEITRDELVLGCVKLTGSATSLDLAVLKLDVEAVRRDVGILVSFMRKKPEGRLLSVPRTPMTPATPS